MAPSSTRRCRPRFAERVRRYMSIRGGWRLVSPHVLSSVLERLERRKEKRQSSTTAGVDSRVWILDLDHGGEMDFVLVEPHRAQPGRRIISILSPFGEALLAARVGDMVHPRFLGHEYSVLVTRVEPANGESRPTPAGAVSATKGRLA